MSEDTSAVNQESPYTPRVIGVRTMKPEEYRGWLHDDNSNFRRFNPAMNDDANVPLIQRLNNYNADGTLLLPPSFEEFRSMGNAAYNLWLRVTVNDSRGNPIELESEEFILWQRSNQSHLPPDVWAAQNNIGLIASPREYSLPNGDVIEIEQGDGESRVIFSRGNVFTSARREGYYGSMEWTAESDGHIIRNSDGRPDCFYTEAEFENLRAGGAPTEPIIIMDLAAASGAFDETKVFFGCRTPDEARALEASSFANPADFAAYNDGTIYHTVTRAQFEAWRQDIRQNPELMEQQNLSFGQWVDQRWGGMARFDAIMNHPMARQLAQNGLTTDELNQLLTQFNGTDGIIGGNDDMVIEEITASAAAFSASNTQGVWR